MFEYIEPELSVVHMIGAGSRCEKIVKNMAGSVANYVEPDFFRIELSTIGSLESDGLCSQEVLTRKFVDSNTFLLFLLISLEELSVVDKVSSIARAAKNADAFTIAVVSPEGDCSGSASDDIHAAMSFLRQQVDSCIDIASDGIVSFESVSPHIIGESALRNYLTRTAALEITRLITTRNLTCIDFEDLAAVLHGPAVHMGIGIAHGENKARTAVERAIAGLANQGMDIVLADGMLVVLAGSVTYMDMNDYTVANGLVHELASVDCNLKLGVLADNDLGENMRVTIFARISGDRCNDRYEC